jgi:TetR/AcrR family transcriptional regulator
LLFNKQARETPVRKPDRERDPDRSRAAILDAAELLFAEQGYAVTSLAEVGLRAGVSRGTPGYFFGSKAELYQAVLDRSFEEVRSAVRSGRERALAGEHTPDEILAGAVSDYFDFLSARPSFVRLIEREALGDGPRAGRDAPPPLSAGEEALAAIAAELGLDPSPSGEAAQLLLSIVSLCWFPLVHADTVARAVGVDLSSADARAERKRHVVALVTGGLRPSSLSRSDAFLEDAPA